MQLMERVCLLMDSVMDLKPCTYNTGGQRLIHRAVPPISSYCLDKAPEYELYFQIVE